MATSIVGIPTTRVSDIFIRERLLRQVQYDQKELFNTQIQLSTGHRLQAPSEDPVAALRIMDLQRLLERKEQVYTNLDTNESYLYATDSALSSVSEMVAKVRGTALGVLGTTAADSQRAAAAQEIDALIDQLVDTGNQKFRGRYLFTGSQTLVQPFEFTDSGDIRYAGNEEPLSSFADIDLLFQTNLNGNEVFGAISEEVQGSVDLNPVLTYDTRLADLRDGLGITAGSISISDGTSSSVIDIAGAETIGDVALMMKHNPPQGNNLEVEITPDGLWVRLEAGDLSIREVGGGTTVDELGILTELGVGTTPVVGRDLDPVVRKTIQLDDVLGARARAVVRSPGGDNDLIFEANLRGTTYDNVTINFQNTAPAAGAENVIWNGVDTLTIEIKQGETRASHVVAAMQAAGTPFSCRVDPLDNEDEGQGLIDPAATGLTDYGAGGEFDQTSGIQIVNGRETHLISLTTAETVEDVLNAFNGANAGLLAEINEDRTGIDIRSRLSGCDFMIGENGGTTATELGLRTFTEQIRLEDLNDGLGVNTQQGTDFTIRRADGVTLDIDLDGTETIDDVLDLINNDPANADGYLTAQLAEYGNGIELVDDSSGFDTLTVTRSVLSRAAIDLGLIADGEDEFESQTQNGVATLSLELAGADNDLTFQARYPGTYGNVQLIFDDTGMNPDSVTYDAVGGTLTFEITLGATRANDIISLVENDPQADAAFIAQLNYAAEPLNTGAGTVPLLPATDMTGGRAEVLTGTDVNPQETKGIFAALLRLREALESNDNQKSQRAIQMLDEETLDMNFARAELGARERSMEIMRLRLDEEEVELREILSMEYDVDIIEVISKFTAKQAAFEASLRATAQTFQMSLLSYL